ncbi:MAG: RCC1 domain-containing protein [Dehalococcoidia bacterium]
MRLGPPQAGRRLIRLAALALAVVGAGLATSTAVGNDAPSERALAHAAKTPKGTGTLVIRVSGLGGARGPLVTVRGPNAPKRPVPAGKRLRLRAGTYQLITKPARTQRGMRYTPTGRITVRVRARKVTQTTLRYSVLVSPRTRALTPAQAQRIDAVTDTSVTLPASAAAGLRPGSVIVAGAGPSTPQGLLRRVVGVRRGGGMVVLATTDATLRDALPDADFRLQIRPSGEVMIDGQTQERRGGTGHANVTISRPFTLEQTWARGSHEGACSFSGAALTMKASVTPTASIDLSASWRFRKPPKITLYSKLDITAATSISGGVEGGCSLERSLPTHRFGAITVFVGPVPVVLVPALSAKAAISFNAGITSTLGGTFSGSVWGTVAYDDGFRTEGGGSRNITLQTPSFGDASAGVEVSAGPELALLFYGGGGPTINASGGVAGDVKPLGNPWWTVDGRVNAQIGGTFDVFGLKAGFSQQILDARWRLADSGGPKAGAPGGPGGGTGGGPGGGTGGGDPPNQDPPDDPTPLFASLATGSSLGYNCGLLRSGPVACWGSSASFAKPPPGTAGVVDLSSSHGNTCAVLTNGRIRCWGGYGFGELGNGYGGLEDAIPGAAYEDPVIGVSGAHKVATGANHSCALVGGGQIRCWGRGGEGQLGDGTTDARSTANAAVNGISGAIEVAAGGDHSCAIMADRSVRCWGWNNNGQLGSFPAIVDPTRVPTPIAVPGMGNVTKLSLGGSNSCAVVSDGRVFCWGNNGSGQLGNGSSANPGGPVQVSGLTNATDVRISGPHACALLTNGSVRCWGSNFRGQLGNGTTSNSALPVDVLGLSDATAIRVGFDGSCAVRRNGAVVCWGANDYGQLGVDATVEQSPVPVEVVMPD